LLFAYGYQKKAMEELQAVAVAPRAMRDLD
jgi:hypothetical protein